MRRCAFFGDIDIKGNLVIHLRTCCGCIGWCSSKRRDSGGVGGCGASTIRNIGSGGRGGRGLAVLRSVESDARGIKSKGGSGDRVAANAEQTEVAAIEKLVSGS